MTWKYILVFMLVGWGLQAQSPYEVTPLSDLPFGFDPYEKHLFRGDTVYLQVSKPNFHRQMYQLDLKTKKLTPLVELERLRYLDEYYRSVDGQISDPQFKPVISERFHKVMGKVGDNFLVIQDNSYYLVDTTGKKSFMVPLGNYSSSHLEAAGITFFDDENFKSKIYNAEGQLLADGIRSSHLSFGNKFLLYATGSDVWEKNIYNRSGKKILKRVEDYVFFDSTAIFKTRNGSIQYLFKDSLLDIKHSDLRSFIPLHESFFKFTSFNRKDGLMNKNFQVILPPQYDRVMVHENNYVVASKKGDEEIGIYEWSPEKQDLELLYSGVIDKHFTSQATNFLILRKVQLKQARYWGLFFNSQRKGIVFSDNWDILYRIDEVKNKEKFPKLQDRRNLSLSLAYPLEILDFYRRDKSPKEEFFVTAYGFMDQNICDIEKRQVLPSNYKIIKKLSPTIFLIGNKNGELQLVEIRER